jgi:4-amino-4-deoxy-L-arabinose transferase-like glycosyltransferase
VCLVMTVMVFAAIVSSATPMAPQRGLVAAGAFVVMGAAILDSGGREAAIARAAGCFGVLLAAPIAGWLDELRRGNDERRPPKVMLVIVHCLVVGWSSRALIRETSAAVVVPAVAAALILATLLLFGTSRRVAVQT